MKTQTTLNHAVATERNWEISIWIFGIIIFAILFANTSLRAHTPQFEEESYIDDIPFDTEMVVHNLLLPELDFEDEKYIDDIPFNTAKVVANYKYKTALAETFVMGEEDYVDDLPFDTRSIANMVVYEEAMNTTYLMDDEDYVNDIPFDTYAIAQGSIKATGRNQYVSVK